MPGDSRTARRAPGHERSGAGDGGEVMSEDDPLVGGNKVAPVFETLGGSGAGVVERQDFRGDELAVEPITDGISTDRGDDQPHGVDVFSAMEGDGAEREGSEQTDAKPRQNFRPFRHEGSQGVRDVLWRIRAGGAIGKAASGILLRWGWLPGVDASFRFSEFLGRHFRGEFFQRSFTFFRRIVSQGHTTYRQKCSLEWPSDICNNVPPTETWRSLTLARGLREKMNRILLIVQSRAFEEGFGHFSTVPLVRLLVLFETAQQYAEPSEGGLLAHGEGDHGRRGGRRPPWPVAAPSRVSRNCSACAPSPAVLTRWTCNSSAPPPGRWRRRPSLHRHIGPGARARCRSVAAQLALPVCLDKLSALDVQVEVGDGADVDWWPQPVVSVAASDHRSTTRLDVGDGAAVRWVEELVLGRHHEAPGRISLRQ